MYMKKTLVGLALSIFLFGAQPFAAAQDANVEPKTASSKPNPRKQLGAYRLDFSINELEDGKKINTRRYSMNITDGQGGRPEDLKIGTRVPVQSEQGKFEYLDIGTNISASFADWDTPMGMNVNAEISSFPASNDGRASGTPPLVRQLRIEGNTVVILDKPIIIGSVDDPDSKRSFQLEVLVTKLQ